MLKIYNTLTKQKEKFKPLKTGWLSRVGLYTCGPTVYNFAHIGNLRSYVFEDILKRILKYNGYKVKHVMNITDVGHLTSDADEGEDKMERGAKREGKTAWEIAEFYTNAFKKNLRDLNIIEPDIWCKATDHIKEQIKLVQRLIDKGFTYKTSDGIYFDTTKIDDYGKMANLKNQELQAGTRVDLGEKRNQHDFALWKFSPAGEKRQMEWDAFGKKGFPGWHIECSAMALKYLGHAFNIWGQFHGERSRTIDIHCGGIDHIPVHHTNEIAQSESVTGKKPWVKYWLHNEFLNMGADKMAKSAGNFITLDTLKERGVSPIAYRYFLLQTHYRKQLTFSWEALEAAESGLKHLYSEVNKLQDISYKLHEKNERLPCLPAGRKDCKITANRFLEAINDDINTPEALAIVWYAIKNNAIDYKTLLDFDKMLGLEFKKTEKLKNLKTDIPDEAQKLLDARATARANKDYTKSDELRDQINKLGFSLKDTGDGQEVSRK